MEHRPAEDVLQALRMWPVMVARLRTVWAVWQARAGTTSRAVALAVLPILVYGYTVTDRL